MLSNPASASSEDLKSLVKLYPAFALPAALLLKFHADKLTTDEIKRLRLHAAISSADHNALYELVSDESNEFADIYPPAQKAAEITTDNVIDTFFANYGMADKSETEMIERLIFNPVPDYSEQLAMEESPALQACGDNDSLESRIDAFIRDHSLQEDAPRSDIGHIVTSQIARPAAEIKVAPPSTDESLLSESLAKIFIKQGRYERAFEIINNLSLNYPKKSIYFADQLRFLQKLIKIKQAQQTKS